MNRRRGVAIVQLLSVLGGANQDLVPACAGSMDRVHALTRMRIAAICTRVSGDKQTNENTIASQAAALMAFAEAHGCGVAPDVVFEDDGSTGATLMRPVSNGCATSCRRPGRRGPGP